MKGYVGVTERNKGKELDLRKEVKECKTDERN